MTDHPMRSAFVALVVLLASTAGCSGDDPTPPDPAEPTMWTGPAANTEPMAEADAAAIDAAAEASLTRADGQVPGLWIGVWDADSGHHQAAYGEAALGETAATTDDHLRIGSITKTFTAAAVLRQVDEATMALDDTVADLLPDLTAAHAEVAGITVDQLLSMTSGIPDYANTVLLIPTVVEDPSRVWTPEEIIEVTLSEEELAEPGTPGYSTTNYLILGEMLEAVTGSPIEQVIGDIVAEVALAQTALPAPQDSELPEPATHGYVFDAGASSLAGSGATVESGTDVTDWTASWGGAGGSMYSTVADLGAWAASGFGNSVLTEDTGAERLDTTELPDIGVHYGRGIMAFGDTGWIGHTGQFIGWEAIAAYDTGTGDVFVGMVNETGALSRLLPVMDRVFPELAAQLA